MDNVINEVGKVEVGLHECRQRLRLLENSARKSISSKVDVVRTTLKQGDRTIDLIATQVLSFLNQIEAVESASVSVDLKPQIKWLQDSLNQVLSDFNAAKDQANDAIACTSNFVYSVMDVAQDVQVKSSRLNDFRGQATALAEKAESDLVASKGILQQTQEQIRRKQQEIVLKTDILATQRQRKSEMEDEIRIIHDQIAEARRQRESRKKDAVVGVGMAILGLIAAVPTGGASLTLTAAGGSLAGHSIPMKPSHCASANGLHRYKAGRMDDFENEATACQQAINLLTMRIVTYEQDIAALRREKTELEGLVHQCENEVSVCLSKYRTHEKCINEAKQAQSEISSLTSHAEATKRNVNDARAQLQLIKSNLERCSELISNTSVEVSKPKPLVERWTERMPVVGCRIEKSGEYNNQMLLIGQVSTILAQVRITVPTILPKQNKRFLDTKPWNEECAIIPTTIKPIPQVSYRTDWAPNSQLHTRNETKANYVSSMT